MAMEVKPSGIMDNKTSEIVNDHEQEIGSLRVKGLKAPDPEVPAKAQRRKFSAQYKKRILDEADG